MEDEALAPEDKKILLRFLKSCLDVLPSGVESQDSNRITICYFALASLDLLEELDNIVIDKGGIVDWLYSLQIVPPEGTDLDGNLRVA